MFTKKYVDHGLKALEGDIKEIEENLEAPVAAGLFGFAKLLEDLKEMVVAQNRIYPKGQKLDKAWGEKIEQFQNHLIRRKDIITLFARRYFPQ